MEGMTKYGNLPDWECRKKGGKILGNVKPDIITETLALIATGYLRNDKHQWR